jgi:hypothetical protein
MKSGKGSAFRYTGLYPLRNFRQEVTNLSKKTEGKRGNFVIFFKNFIG